MAAGLSVVATGVLTYYAYSADDRQYDQERTQYANKVYIGEAPQHEYAKMGEDVHKPRLVVINASGTQVEHTWVQAKNGRVIRLQGVQRCTMYALPYDFGPKDLYFSDPYGNWHRSFGGQVDRAPQDLVEPTRGSADSPWADDISGCAG